MLIVWLGQAGLWFEGENLKIMIDPYLSDSVKEVNPKHYRRVLVNNEMFDLKPDIMIFTHNHLDHYDPETVKKFLRPESGITVLAPLSVWNEVRKIGGDNNYVLFDRHTEWTQENIRFSAVRAVHSDPSAIGVVIETEGKIYYVTGDTLYNTDIFSDLPQDIYAVFLPVNGMGNNMNMVDAKRFCEKVNPRFAVPMHCGLFDEIDMHAFVYEQKVVPEFYQEIQFNEE